MSETSSTTAVAVNRPISTEPATSTLRATFQINSTKLYVPVVTSSIIDSTEFSENIKEGFKRTFFFLEQI